MVLDDTLCTILLSCESSQVGTVGTLLLYRVLHMDQDLAGVILSYQTTLLVTRILILIVAGTTPSHQRILYMVGLSVRSMLEATISRQQISKYSMKQPHKELYPELLTLCFSLLLFVCL